MFIDKESQNDIIRYWNTFTNILIEQISILHPNIIWVLWGDKAKAKSQYIKSSFSNIYKYIHPSPTANNRLQEEDKFENIDHFTQINQMLTNNKIETINWNVIQNTVIYCDGSCFGNNSAEKEDRQAGYAILFTEGPLMGDLYYQSLNNIEDEVPLTNNRAELYAIIKSLELCLKYQSIGQLTIITDSKYSYDMMTSFIYRWDDNDLLDKKNADLFKIIRAYCNQVNKYYAKYGGIQSYFIERNSTEPARKVDKYAKMGASYSDDNLRKICFSIDELK